MTFLLAFALLCAPAYAKQPSVRQSTDASWAKAYAASCQSSTYTCPPSTRGYENAFNGDPRLPRLLKHSLPQQESWWVNERGGAAAVSSIVQEFIGVPGDLLVDSNRYVTANGCVPHDCFTNGMLWIDSSARPATVIFVAEVSIESIEGDDKNHLWIYTSTFQNFGVLPSNFLTSLKRWHSSISTSQYPQTITIVTLVQPNGRMEDVTYEMLFYKYNSAASPNLPIKP